MTRKPVTFPVLFAAAASLFPISGLRAEDSASPWVADVHSASRLIAGNKATTESGPVLRAGIEIKLDPGWKTYWRYPGDSGVPPRFDFSGSDNLRSAKVLYPAPHEFTDEAGNSIGYKDAVVFPLQVVARDPAKPVRLRLKLDYATCEKLCVPAEGRGQLTLSGTGDADAVVTAAEALVPKPAKLGDSAPLAIRALRRVNNAAKPLVMVEVAAPAGAKVELFAEGPTPEWALPVPAPAPGGPEGTQQFSFELDGLPPGANPASKDLTLTLTAVAGKDAIEVPAHLD
ncbi:MAG TPA: protein-disulfide reductase DsbD domain-containing protein [Pseudolabrys sp.]|nr:protein-disulfide reductase DsbD domain-containing protein [Pseudolabrys sp.]